MSVGDASVFGGHDLPIIKVKNKLYKNEEEIYINEDLYNNSIFYKNGEPTFFTMFLRVMIIGTPIAIICFLMYKCSQLKG